MFLYRILRSYCSCSKVLIQCRNGRRPTKICQKDSLIVIFCLLGKYIYIHTYIYKTSGIQKFEVQPILCSAPRILGQQKPNVSSHKKASCQMLEQLMAQMTEVAICLGQLSFCEAVPWRTTGRHQMAWGGCSGCPQGHGLLVGAGCSRFPGRYRPGEVGFKSQPLKTVQVNMNEFEAEGNNYCCEGTATARLSSHITSEYPNH